MIIVQCLGFFRTAFLLLQLPIPFGLHLCLFQFHFSKPAVEMKEDHMIPFAS